MKWCSPEFLLNILQNLFQNGNYNQVFKLLDNLEDTIELPDHLGGFDADLNNTILSAINNQASQKNQTHTVIITFPLDPDVKAQYPTLNFQYHIPKHLFCAFDTYNIHPPINFKNFICSFNRAPHVGRQLLVAILHKFNWFNPNYCSKHFSFDASTLDGHIETYTGTRYNLYNKFFLAREDDNFFQYTNNFEFSKIPQSQNIYKLDSRLTESFVHLVSETMATSYYPLITEKFLYSVITRGLFLTYGQPGWYAHLEKYFGFKRYDKLFDYRFDSIQNPVTRLVELMTMLGKFSHLSQEEWNELYLIESDTIEYNYDHYFSGNYLNKLKELA